MGTRADFYVRKNDSMQWIGSKSYDGYPDGIGDGILLSTTEKEYKEKTLKWLKSKDDATLPQQGWPWPWNDSRTTDYSYIFENGKVMASCFGYPLFDPLIKEGEGEKEDESESRMDNYFPDMSFLKNVAIGKRSGVIVVTSRGGDISIDG